MAVPHQKQTNSTLQRLLLAGHYGYVVLDQKGSIQEMNTAAAALLGCPPDCGHQNFFMLFPAPDEDSLRFQYQAMQVDEERIFNSTALPGMVASADGMPKSGFPPVISPVSKPADGADPAAASGRTGELLRHTVIRTGAGWEILLEYIPAQAAQEPSHRDILYRTLARSMPQTSVVLFDKNLVHILAEGELFSRDTFISWDIEGQTLDEAFPPEFAEELKPLYHAAINGAVSIIELTYDGSHYNIFIQPVHNDRGEVLAGMCVIVDVTVFKQTENALRENEQRIRALLYALPDQIFIMHHDGFSSSLDVHGINLFENTSSPQTSLRDLPEKVQEELHDHLLIALDARTVSTFEYELHQGQGPLEGSYEARIIALDDNDTEAMIVVRDITPLKQVQSELRQRVQELTVLSQVEAELTEQLNLGYVLTIALDAALRLSKAEAGFVATIVNNQFDQARVSGAFPILDLGHFLAQENSAIAAAIRQRKLVHCLDTSQSDQMQPALPDTSACIVCPIIWRDEVVALLNLEFRHANPFSDHTLDVMRTMMARTAVAIDNSRMYQQTASHLLETQMLYDRVSKLEMLKTEMIRIASHDLRNPLSVVLSYIGMIRDDLHALGARDVEGVQGTLDYLENVEIASQQMRKIILNILSLERIEEMAKEAQFDDCDFGQLVEQGYHEARGLAQLKAQVFTRHLDVTHPIVKADPTQLGEAISNLISNAIKYTPEHGRIDLRLEQVGSNLVFSVIDNGYGIRDAQQVRLFEPFFRAKSPETREIDGSGLGLHLVRKIIERHGGDLFFHSVYQKGSTFGFTIPILTDG